MNKNLPAWLNKKKYSAFLIVLLICASVFLIYHQSFQFDFINFDDPVYVTDNPAVKQGINYESLTWAFGIHSDICMYYQPIAWISHMADCQWFGLDPGKHHRTSVIIHGINAILLFFILISLTGSLWRSAFVALIFAVHPVNTDAVAWISERKTVLSAFFWLLGTGAYLVYCRKPSVSRYIPLIVFFSLGLFTKPVLITFPCAMILLDLWPLKRISTDPIFSIRDFFAVVKEKIPLIFVIVLWSITPFLSETLMANETLPDVVPYSLRISNALVSYSKYIYKFFFPLHLSILYPYPTSIPFLYTVLAFIFLLLITLWAIYRYTSRPYLLIGWLWFAGTLFPTSGLILGTLWPELADRWAYIPYMGLAIMTAWTIPDCRKQAKGMIKSISIIGGSIIFIVYLGLLSYKQTAYWKNSSHIFEKALSVIGYHALPHQNIASEWIKQGDYDQAKKHLDIILSHEPNHVETLYNMGLCLFKTGHSDDAWVYARKALNRDPEHTQAYILMARILSKNGNIDDAIKLYETALQKKGNHRDILYNLSFLLIQAGQKEKAEQRLIQLLSTYPKDPRGYGAYADLLLERNAYKKALQYSLIQTSLQPGSAKSFNRAGLCYIHLGEFKNAIEKFKQAVDLDPEYAEAVSNLKTSQTDLAELELSRKAIAKALSLESMQPLPHAPYELEKYIDSHSKRMDRSSQHIIIYGNLAKIYRIHGQYLTALDIYKRLSGKHPEYDASINYNIACLYALINRADDSVQHLKQAIEKDNKLLEHAEKDGDFNLIRHLEAYQRLIETYRHD